LSIPSFSTEDQVISNSWQIGKREQVNHILADRIDAVRRNHKGIIWIDQLSARSIRVGAVWIIDHVTPFRKIAVVHGGRGNGINGRDTLPDASTCVVTKNKSSILYDRPPQVSPELVATEGFLVRTEEIPRIQYVIANEFVSAAVDLVCS